MVIINHSLGGDLTHLQVIDTGDVLVKGIFKQNAPKIMALPQASPIKQALVFKANSRIKRVVFVAAPHRGAPLAVNFVGRIGAALIHLPGAVISDIGTATIEEAAIAAGLRKNFLPNSINGLEPTNLPAHLNERGANPCPVPFDYRRCRSSQGSAGENQRHGGTLLEFASQRRPIRENRPLPARRNVRRSPRPPTKSNASCVCTWRLLEMLLDAQSHRIR